MSEFHFKAATDFALMTNKTAVLVEKWRQEAADCGHAQRETADTLAQCADDLEAVLNGSKSGVDAAFEQIEHEKDA